MKTNSSGISINEELDGLKVSFLMTGNNISLDIYYQNNLIFQQVFSDKNNKIPEIIKDFPTEKKTEYLMTLLEKSTKLMYKLDCFRAGAIVHICNIFNELTTTNNYDLLNKNISPKPLWFFEKLEVEGKIKRINNGKYKVIGTMINFIKFCFDAGYIEEEKGSLDVLTPEILIEYIETKRSPDTIKKYIRDLKDPKPKKKSG